MRVLIRERNGRATNACMTAFITRLGLLWVRKERCEAFSSERTAGGLHTDDR